MATRPAAQIAVHVTLSGWDTPVLLVFDEAGAANNVTSQLNDKSDAAAEVLGAIQETPMITTDAALPGRADEKLRADFALLMPGKRLLALADLTENVLQPDRGVYFTARALWVHERQKIVEDVAVYTQEPDETGMMVRRNAAGEII